MALHRRRQRLKLRAELTALVDALLADTKAGDAIDLDRLGEAIGARKISQEEIDLILVVIEQRGRHVASPDGAHGEGRLKIVLDTARALRAELGRAPTADEIATRAGIRREDVRHALALARVMQR